MAVVQSGNELGLAVLKALGIEATGVLRLSISMRANELATVTVVRSIDKVEADRLVTELQRFDLVRKDDPRSAG